MRTLAVAHAVLAHPGEPDGRVVVLESQEPRTAGLIVNSPWPVLGKLPPQVMAAAANSDLGKHMDATSGRATLDSLIRTLEDALQPLAAAPVDENIDGLWDFGGELAAICLGSESSALARVGDLRVMRLRGSRLETLLAENTLMAEARALRRDLSVDAARNIVTDSLARGRAPRTTRILDVEAGAGTRFVLATGSAVDRLRERDILSIVEGQSRSDAARDLAEACAAALRDMLGREATTVAVMVVDVVACRRIV